MTKKRFVADVVLCAVPILKVGTYRVQHSKSHPRLFFTSKNSLRSQSSKKTVRKTIENIFKMKKICIMLLIGAVAMGMTSCKAWRAISTTSTYTQVGDSSKVTTTISSKTVEEYTGVKKWPVIIRETRFAFRKTSSIAPIRYSRATRPWV